MLNLSESKIDQISSNSQVLDTIERYTTQNPIGLAGSWYERTTRDIWKCLQCNGQNLHGNWRLH